MRTGTRCPNNPRTTPKTSRSTVWNRVLLVVDDPSSSPGLIQFVHGEKAMEMCAISAASGLALKKIASLKPDLVVLDIALVGRGGLDLFKRIKAQHPTQSVVMVSIGPRKGLVW
jgi:DNA-binding NarL/FixJ family response regulator